MPEEAPVYLTRHDLARVMKVSLRTVDAWLAMRLVSHFRKGAIVRIELEDALKFALMHTVKARAGYARALPDMERQQLQEIWSALVRLVVLAHGQSPIGLPKAQGQEAETKEAA